MNRARWTLVGLGLLALSAATVCEVWMASRRGQEEWQEAEPGDGTYDAGVQRLPPRGRPPHLQRHPWDVWRLHDPDAFTPFAVLLAMSGDAAGTIHCVDERGSVVQTFNTVKLNGIERRPDGVLRVGYAVFNDHRIPHVIRPSGFDHTLELDPRTGRGKVLRVEDLPEIHDGGR